MSTVPEGLLPATPDLIVEAHSPSDTRSKIFPKVGLLPTTPDLVVEVRSPPDTWTEIYAKVGEYLGARVRVVIVLDSASTSASVYRADELPQIFHNGGELVVPDVLPGFAVAVSRLFE